MAISLVSTSLLALGRAQAATAISERSDLQRIFQEKAATGCFVLYDTQTDQLTVVDAQRAQKRYIPASTFKIANSIIALETGAVKDENEIIPYGGKPQPFKAWEKDMPMREAITISNVPVYQEIARRIGEQHYNNWLVRLDYGNHQTGSHVDRFWLDGPLEISAIEQAKFIARLAKRQLPISNRTHNIVRDIIRMEAKGATLLFGKTGWCFSCTPQLGWWTGWIEHNDHIYSFALNMDILAPEDTAKRVAIGKALLSNLGVF